MRTYRSRGRSPAQALALVAFRDAVVMPASHTVQLGLATVSLPPALQEPLAQTVQLGPPLPAGQCVSVVAGRAAASSRQQISATSKQAGR